MPLNTTYKVYGHTVFVGTKTSIKPTVEVPYGSVFYETDTNTSFTWKGSWSIDSKVDTVYGLNVTVYVDPVGGLDANTGAIDSKFKTLDRVFDMFSSKKLVDSALSIVLSNGTTSLTKNQLRKLTETSLFGSSSVVILGTETTVSTVTASYSEGDAFITTNNPIVFGYGMFIKSASNTYYPVMKTDGLKCYIPINTISEAVGTFTVISMGSILNSSDITTLELDFIKSQKTTQSIFTLKSLIIASDNDLSVSSDTSVKFENISINLTNTPNKTFVVNSIKGPVCVGVGVFVNTTTGVGLINNASDGHSVFSRFGIHNTSQSTGVGSIISGSVYGFDSIYISGFKYAIELNNGFIKQNSGYISVKVTDSIFNSLAYGSEVIYLSPSAGSNCGIINNNTPYLLNTAINRNHTISAAKVYGTPLVSVLSPTSTIAKLIDISTNTNIRVIDYYQEYDSLAKLTVSASSSSTFNIGSVAFNDLILLKFFFVKDTFRNTTDFVIQPSYDGLTVEYVGTIQNGIFLSSMKVNVSFNIVDGIIRCTVSSLDSKAVIVSGEIKRNVIK